MENTLNDNEDSDIDTKSSPDSLSSINISYSEIAKKLLNDKLFLTALELHAELLEAGKEIPKLREFFSNPGNFENYIRSDTSPCIHRSSSQATLDSLDFTRFSEDGERGNDEKIAVLEFELRKAKETISALRANLTVVTVGESVGEECCSERSSSSEVIKPHEEKALNFLINEYLLCNSYKLTSITFADENETQDFEDWEDVGINRGRPASLLELYRGRGLGAPVIDACTQVDESAFTGFQEGLHGDSNERLGSEFEVVEKDNYLSEDDMRLYLSSPRLDLEGNVVDNLSTLSNDGSDLKTKEKVEEEFRDVWDITDEASNHHSCQSNHTYIGLSGEMDDLEAKFKTMFNKEETEKEGIESDKINWDTNEDNELEEKRIERMKDSLKEEEETSPLLHIPEFTNVEESELPIHFSSGQRKAVWTLVVGQGFPTLPPPHYSLLRLLVDNIAEIAKHLPLNEFQWMELAVRLIVTTAVLNPNEMEKESLISYLVNLKKRPDAQERDLIVKGLGALSECSNASVIEGLVLSQVCQLVSHKIVEKRLLAINASPILAALLPEELRDSLLFSMLEQLLNDKEEAVKEAAVGGLALLTSLHPIRKYEQIELLLVSSLSETSPRVLYASLNLLLPVLANWSLGIGRFDSSLMYKITSTLETSIVGAVTALTFVIPHIILFLAMDPEVTIPTFQRQLSLEVVSRKELKELWKGLSAEPFLCEILKSSTLDEMMVNFDMTALNFTDFWPRLEWLCDSVLSKLVKLCEKGFENKQELVTVITFFDYLCSAIGSHLTVTKIKNLLFEKINVGGVVAVYVLAVAPYLSDKTSEIRCALGKALSNPPTSPALLYAISKLASSNQFNNSELLTSSLWQGVVDERREVKLGAIEAISAALKGKASPSTLLPLIITLASDQDPYVRGSSLSILGLVMEYSNETEVLEKSRVQVQSILRDSSVREKLPVELISSLAKMASHVEQSFREEIVAVELASFVGVGVKSEVASALVDAYSNTVYLQMGKNTISNIILPSLRALEWICIETLPTHTKTVTVMIKEMEGRLDAPKNLPSTRDEMRQRVTKIFGSPGTIPNIFKKK